MEINRKSPLDMHDFAGLQNNAFIEGRREMNRTQMGSHMGKAMDTSSLVTFAFDENDKLHSRDQRMKNQQSSTATSKNFVKENQQMYGNVLARSPASGSLSVTNSNLASQRINSKQLL